MPALLALPAAAQVVRLSDLAAQTHVHGIAVDRQDPQYLLVATHHGLFRAGADGQAELISPVQDFMGFTPHPDDPERLFASGHPAAGGNLGFIESADNGRSWQQVGAGVDGPVDFHQMTVSAADPDVIYGAYGGLQVSRDGGRSWEMVAPLPDGLIDLAASREAPEIVYAATDSGLRISRDGGESWDELFGGAPVGFVEVTADGSVYAFSLERGLMRANEADLDFATLDPNVRPILVHFAADPEDPTRLFAAALDGRILASGDGGRTWDVLGE